MSNIVNVPFEVTMTFTLPDGSLGVVLRQVTNPRLYFAVQVDAVFKAKPVGSVFNVECTQKPGRTLSYPSNMEKVWEGPIGNSARQIQRLYLTYLYARGLNARSVNRDTPKDFSPEAVFKTPILVLLESLYDTIHTPKLREVLSATNFLYGRKAIYTAPHWASAGQSYPTPRSLSWYPEQKTVVATYHMVSGLGIEPNALPEEAMVKHVGNMLQIQRAYQNEGWISLRDLMKSEPKLEAMVRTFIDDFGIKPVDLSAGK